MVGKNVAMDAYDTAPVDHHESVQLKKYSTRKGESEHNSLMKLNTFNRNFVKNEKMKKFDLILQSQHGGGESDEDKGEED